jgi:Flp pilus assembly CpaF family ATPase
MSRRGNRQSNDKEEFTAPVAANWFDVPPTPPANQNQEAQEVGKSLDATLVDVFGDKINLADGENPPTSEHIAGSDLSAGAQLGELFEDVNTSVQAFTATPSGISLAAGRLSDNKWTGYRELEGIWPIVEQFRNYVSTDAVLQAKAKELILTRDAEVNEHQKYEIVSLLTKSLAARGGIAYKPEQMGPALDLLYDEIVGISVLGDLWRDDNVTEIMVDRWDRVVVEFNGKLQVTDVRFRDAEHANDVARSLALRVSDRSVSQKLPLVTAELPQARVTFCYGPVVRGGLSITIRKFRPLLTLETLLANNSVNQELVELLRDLVHARATILVSGGTGTGKTTIINLLSSFIPDSERVITIEDAFELQLTNTHVVSLQTKEASSSDDQVSVTLSDLLRNTLRMRPDRIIVGEVREGEGALTMLAAANTGHDGTMTTIHANSPSMAVNERLTDLIRQTRATPDDVAKRTIASAFDVVVQVSRTSKGQRFISEVAALEPSSIVAGQVLPETMFVGEEGPDGKITFRRSGRIRPDSRLGRKLAMTLVNPRRWA